MLIAPRFAAQRRRGRRQRAALRQEQQSIAMALAAATHHTGPRDREGSGPGGWSARAGSPAHRGEDRRLSSRLSQCPRSRKTPFRCARFSLSRRWRSSWWKCHRTLLQCCRVLARVVFLDTEVFKVSSQNSTSFLQSSRPSTLQIQAVVILEVFKVSTQDMVRCSALMSRSLHYFYLPSLADSFCTMLDVPRQVLEALGRISNFFHVLG